MENNDKYLKYSQDSFFTPAVPEYKPAIRVNLLTTTDIHLVFYVITSSNLFNIDIPPLLMLGKQTADNGIGLLINYSLSLMFSFHAVANDLIPAHRLLGCQT